MENLKAHPTASPRAAVPQPGHLHPWALSVYRSLNLQAQRLADRTENRSAITEILPVYQSRVFSNLAGIERHSPWGGMEWLDVPVKTQAQFANMFFPNLLCAAVLFFKQAGGDPSPTNSKGTSSMTAALSRDGCMDSGICGGWAGVGIEDPTAAEPAFSPELRFIQKDPLGG
ncbi:unnamed protein product [Arctogadus glacialis]